jgi:hypothetical protein
MARGGKSTVNSASFQILQGEKFAALALSRAWTQGLAGQTHLGSGLWVLTQPPVDVGGAWREWIGSIRADEIADANLWFLAKRPSKTPGVVDQENNDLKDDEVWRLFLACLLIGPLWYEGGYLMTGGNAEGNSVVRQFSDAELYLRSEGGPDFAITDKVIQGAARVKVGLDAVFASAGHMRIRGGLIVFWKGLRERFADTRVHQFVRSVEGVVKPDIGKSRGQFVHRCQTFTGLNPDASSILQECYDLRSQAEHLHYWQGALLAHPPKDREAVLLRHVRQMEALARHVYFRILTSPAHQALLSDVSIDAFWHMDEKARHAQWRQVLDIRTIK